MKHQLADKWPPTRTDASVVIGVIAVILALIVAITSSVLAGITLLLGFSGVLSLTWLLIPARPRLAATLKGRENASQSVDGSLVVGGGQAIRPLDVEAIVQAEESAARETMPRQPTPKVPPGMLGSAYEPYASVADTLASLSGVSDDDLRAFLVKVRSYGDKLRRWLEELEAGRAERLREFSLAIRAEELGQTSADFVRARLVLPSSFQTPKPSQYVPAPPKRPEFVGAFGIPLGAHPPIPIPDRVGSLAHLIPDTDAIRGVSAEYSSEDDTTLVDLNIGHINQNEHRDTAEFSLRAGPVGSHEVRWRISANGLDKPAKGTLTIEVKEPESTEPICDLADALKERKQYRLDR